MSYDLYSHDQEIQRLRAAIAEERRLASEERRAKYEAEQQRLAAEREATNYSGDPGRLTGFFDRYAAANAERRELMRKGLDTLMPEGSAEWPRPHPSYSRMGLEGRLLTLGSCFHLNTERDAWPMLVLDPADWQAGRYTYRHPSGVLPITEWRKALPKIADYLNHVADHPYQWTLTQSEPTEIVLHRRRPLPAVIPFDLAMLKRGQVFFGYDVMNGVPIYTPIADLMHTLACGRNGEGKSNFLSGILLSLLFNSDLLDGLTLVDLKGGVELARFAEVLPEKIDFVDQIDQLPELTKRLVAQMGARFAKMRAAKSRKVVDGFRFVIIDEFAPIELHKPAKADKPRFDAMKADLVLLAAQGRAPGIRLWAQLQQPVDAMMDTAFRVQLQNIVAFKIPSNNASMIFDGAEDFPVRPSDLPPYRCVLALLNQPKRVVQAPLIADDIDLAAIIAAGQQARFAPPVVDKVEPEPAFPAPTSPDELPPDDIETATEPTAAELFVAAGIASPWMSGRRRR